jgi:hypothetical protein
MLVLDAARTTNRAFTVVRFGNVLGSRGSIIPTFKNQIANPASDPHRASGPRPASKVSCRSDSTAVPARVRAASRRANALALAIVSAQRSRRAFRCM